MNHKEKIRQFVIMARHPEAMDYKQALNNEFEEKGCLFIAQPPESKATLLLEIYTPKESASCHSICVGGDSWSNGETYNLFFNGAQKYINKILGRPITAMDVCWALTKNQSPDDFYAQNYNVAVNGIYGNDYTVCYFETIKPDGTHTTLEDWDEETYKKISNEIEATRIDK